MRKWKGYGFFVAMAAIILIAMISSDFMSGWTEENYTYTQFKDDLSNHKYSPLWWDKMSRFRPVKSV